MKYDSILISMMILSLALFLTMSCSASEDSIDDNQDSLGKDVEVIVYPGEQIMTSKLLLSTTLTHRSFSNPQYTEAVARAESYLEQYTDCLAQFTMDWGAGNTNPSKNVYNFK